MNRRSRPIVLSALALLAAAGAAHGQQVKISQVYGGGGNTGAPFNRDFVELFNAGATPVDISGWSLQYAAATGTPWSKTDLSGFILQPGQYYLVQMTLTGTNGDPLPAPDHVVGTAIAMSATAGKVALVSNTTALTGACPTGAQIIDFVGFGTTANCFEGSGPTAAPANPTAVIRNSDGCDDAGGTVGDNAANFAVGTPNPRNTSSPVNLCPLPPGADLGVTVSDSATQVNLGGISTFIVTVTNFGPDTSPSATVTIPVPANANFLGSSPFNTPVDGVLTFVTGPIAAAGTEAIGVTLQGVSGAALAVQAGVTGPLPDAVTGNNTANDSTLLYSRDRARVVAGADAFLPVSAVDTASGATETLFFDNVRALASDDADRVLYYSKGTQLWRVSYDNIANPELVGSFNGAVTTISGGMAFDSMRRNLIVSTTSSFYTVDTETARTTLLRAVGSGDFGGLDYDPVADRLVATNDATATTNGLSGRGLYRIDPYGSDIQFINFYPIKTEPSTLDTDIDALAYGGGVIYPIADEDRWFYRYDESSGTYLSPFVTGYGADRTQNGATYTTELFSQSPGANLSVKVSGPDLCVTPLGDAFTVTVSAKNLGPSTATGALVEVTLPTGLEFVSSTPPLTPVGGVISYAPGDLPSAGTADVSIVVRAVSTGDQPVSATASSGVADAFPSNNSATRQFRVPGSAPTTFTSEAVFSSFAGSNTIPGFGAGVISDVVDMGRPFASQNGQNWVMVVDTDIADTNADQVMLRGSGTDFQVVVQEGTTPVPGTASAVRTFDAVLSVNNNGDFAFGTDYDGSSTAFGESILKSVSGVLSIVADQGTFVTPIVGASFGSSLGSACISNAGEVSFYTTLTGATTTTDSALLRADGAVLVAQEGVDMPTGQINADLYNEFATGATLGQGFFVAADGVSYSVRATMEGAAANDIVHVVNGAVVAQEGTILPGSSFVSPITAVNMNYMNPGGVWTAYGSNADTIDWAVVDGNVVAVTDQEIFPGAGEFWDDATYAQEFFLCVANNTGQYVVGGLTSAADLNANAALVANGSRVILREDDPIDLNRNGIFDDDAYIHIFRDDFAFLTDDGWFYIAVRTRSGAHRCLGTAPTENGQALIRVRLTCRADYNGDGNIDPDDLADYIGCYFEPGGGCSRADFNGDGNADPDDLADYIGLFFSGGC
ncbi:MAG: lamin tail domain-containing protein [Phycisphaerae bacterium]|nr:lamin tail domain-containing protein [Phycisphaerae bacterium]